MAEKADNISSETRHEKSDHVEVIVTLDGAESRIQWKVVVSGLPNYSKTVLLNPA